MLAKMYCIKYKFGLMSKSAFNMQFDVIRETHLAETNGNYVKLKRH